MPRTVNGGSPAMRRPPGQPARPLRARHLADGAESLGFGLQQLGRVAPEAERGMAARIALLGALRGVPLADPAERRRLYRSASFASSTSWSQGRSHEDRISSSQKYTGTPAGWSVSETVYDTIRPHQALGYLTPAEYLGVRRGQCVSSVLTVYTWLTGSAPSATIRRRTAFYKFEVFSHGNSTAIPRADCRGCCGVRRHARSACGGLRHRFTDAGAPLVAYVARDAVPRLGLSNVWGRDAISVGVWECHESTVTHPRCAPAGRILTRSGPLFVKRRPDLLSPRPILLHETGPSDGVLHAVKVLWGADPTH